MRTTLLKKLMLPILLCVATCINLNAATGSMSIGGTSVPDLSINDSGTGWEWVASSATLNLTDSYTGEAIAINCAGTDDIKLVYTGNVSISSADADAIYCEGSLTINEGDGSGRTLSLAYTGDDLYSAISNWGVLTINSGNVYASCASLGSSMNPAAAVRTSAFNITGDANVTTQVTSAYSNGLLAGADSEISTTGLVSVNATGKGYAINIVNYSSLTISNGVIYLSNSDTPENMIYGKLTHGLFKMTGGEVVFNSGIPPTLTSISPASGTCNETVVLSGSNLTGATNVFVNGKATTSFVTYNDSELIFTTPGAEAGVASILVETAGGAAFLTDAYTYTSTSYRATIRSGGAYSGTILGFVDTEGGTITKPNTPEPINSDGEIFVSTGRWYKDMMCTTEWDFDTDIVNSDMDIYAQYKFLPGLTPADGAVDVAIDAIVMAEFYSYIGTITVDDLSGITLFPDPGNVSASFENRVMTIAHDDFEYGTEYTVTIPAEATNEYLIDIIWKFTTASDPVSDATLSGLTVSEGILTPAFSASTKEYTVTVANSISSITIDATANNGNATIDGAGTKPLNAGANTFDIVVTAEDGTTMITYKVTVTRQSPQLSTDATLYGLTVSEGILTPAFSASTTEYTVTVPNSVNSITINAAANDGNAIISGAGIKTLNVGENLFDVVVMAENGITETYKVTVIRVQDTVGIEDVYPGTGIQIYPNPITDYFHVKGITEPTIVSVYTANGKIVLQRKVEAEENILTGNLPDGIYLINVSGTTFKVMKK